jgi:hypothetical protein
MLITLFTQFRYSSHRRQVSDTAMRALIIVVVDPVGQCPTA